MNRLLIIGAGGHGKVAEDIARLNGYTDVYFLDDNLNSELPVIGSTNDFSKFIDDSDFFIAIGNSEIRKNFFDKLKAYNASIINLIHPNATISNSATIGEGVLVAAGAFVGPSACVCNGAIVNTLSSIDHDCYLGEFSHVSAGVHTAGGTKIDSFTFVGVGSTVIKNICSHCFIGAGAVVVKEITEKGTYIGVPARLK